MTKNTSVINSNGTYEQAQSDPSYDYLAIDIPLIYFGGKSKR